MDRPQLCTAQVDTAGIGPSHRRVPVWVRLKKMGIGKKQPLLFRNINIDGKSYEKWLLPKSGVCLWEGCDREGGTVVVGASLCNDSLYHVARLWMS